MNPSINICRDCLFYDLSFIKYCGLFNILKCCLAKYSPIIPIANNCAPEKIEIIDAKKGKPGTGDPCKKKRTETKNNTPRPKTAKKKFPLHLQFEVE